MHRFLKSVILTGWLLLAAFPLRAAIDVYEFKSPAEEARFQALIADLRCPKCQNQNLAGSDALIAKDLKDKAYQLMEEGKSDAEIRQYMVERYGDFILYKPPVRSTTLLLWGGPFALLAAVAAIWAWRRRRSPEPAKPLTPEEQARLQELLRNADDER